MPEPTDTPEPTDMPEPTQTPEPNTGNAPKPAEQQIIDNVMAEFLQLAKVPRPSHHEEKISAFLMGWAEGLGLQPVQDQALNVMFDVPATEGYEDCPLGILQVHMDMVVAVAEGKAFDSLNDPITVVWDKAAGTVTADGTSLGADDGIGVAIVMAAAEGKMNHGPLRVIITVNEEDGMDGAFHVDSAWLDGAEFLINIDNEESDTVLVSTAAGDAAYVDSKLLEKTKRIYREQNGEEIRALTLHEGLECGTFKALKPDLDMISIGPDLADVHTVHETLYLRSVPKVWRLLEGLLTEK